MKPFYRNALGFHCLNKACVQLQSRNGLGGPVINWPSVVVQLRVCVMAQTGVRAELQLESAFTMQIHLRILQLKRAMTLFVQLRVQCSKGKSQTTHVRLWISQLLHARSRPVPFALNMEQLSHLTRRTVDENGAERTEELHFFYDVQSRPAKVNYNGVIYTFVHNLQGDIVGIIDNAGTLVLEYKYDAWGRLLSTTGTLADTLGKRNPFRYRGYVYDEESGLYYLRSRYYNPVWQRFVNSDNYLVSRGSLFAYCDNRPVVAIDRSGHRYTYDAIDAYAKPPQMSDLISDFFSRVSEKIGRIMDYSKLGSGTVKYRSETKVVATSSAESVAEQLLQHGIAALSGVLSTVLISNPVVGGFVSVAQYTATELAEWQVALSVPSIPEGVYTHETVEYREDVPGFFGYTYVQTCHYLHGYDVTGCTYFAIWEETYSYTALGVDYSSRVLAQRAQ